MAVTRLGAGAAGTGTTTATWTGFNITASGAGTIAVVLVNWSTGTNATATCSVTYGGTAMKQLGIQLGGATTSRSGCGIYYLFNPGTGAKTIVVTPAGVTPTQVRGIDVAFSGVSSIGQPQNVATMAHTVTSKTNGYALRVLSNGVTTGTLGGGTTELASGASVGGVGDFIAVQSQTGAATVAFTASGTATTPISTGVNLNPAGEMNFVQVAASTQPSAATSNAVAMPGPVTPGDIILACPQINSGAQTISSITDTQGNAYTFAVVGSVSQTLWPMCWVYWARAKSASDAGANTVTVTYSASATFPELVVVEYDGLAASPVDRVVGNQAGATTTPTSGNTGTTTQADELVFGYGNTGGTTSAAGAGYTGRIVGTDTASSIVQDKVVAATGVQSSTCTTSSNSYSHICVTLKKALPPAGGQVNVSVYRAANF